jgi:bacillithiol system protein YtxJ
MSQELRDLRDTGDLEEAFTAPLAVVFKHSPRCGLSALTAREIAAFLEARPEVPVYRVDVVQERPLSAEVERRSGVRHESPQVLVLRDGTVEWHGSHRAITAEALGRATPGDDAPERGPGLRL